MSRSQSSKASPRATHVGVGFRCTPFHERGVSEAQELWATALPFLAHDRHAPLVVIAGAAAAWHAHVLDYLAVEVVLRLDHMANVDPAVAAGVGRIMIFGRWVGSGYGRVIHVNSSILLAAPPGD